MLTLPDAGAAVVLRDEHGGEYRSSVLTLTEKAIVLQPPVDLTDVGVGTRLLVTWPDGTSICFLPVVITATDLVIITAVDVRKGAWEVRIADDPWREERRRHIRQAIDATLDVAYEADGEVHHAEAIVVDLSEAAVRCAVTRDHQALRVGATSVRLALVAKGEAFDITGYVLNGRPAAREDLRLEVVILFNRPVPDVDRLRTHLV